MYTFKQDIFYQYDADGSLLNNRSFQVTDINQTSNGFASFKLLIELSKLFQQRWGRKHDAYFYKVIDINTIKICDGKEGNPCGTYLIIKRTN